MDINQLKNFNNNPLYKKQNFYPKNKYISLENYTNNIYENKNQNRSLNNEEKIFPKKININSNSRKQFNITDNPRENYNNINTDNNEIKEMNEPLENNLVSNIYEKNIALLNEKIKEQESEIEYLNNRLKNYDETMDEITQLNIELNKLNEIIRNKNITIQEYREISELSKTKFEQLIKNKNELLQRIKILEQENKELKNKYNENDTLNMNYNTGFSQIKREEYDKMKVDLYNIIQENRDLKNQLQEKNYEINNLNEIIERANIKNASSEHNNINNNLDIDYNKIRNRKLYNNERYNNDFNDISNNNYNYKYNYNNLKKNDYLYPLPQERSHTPLIRHQYIPPYQKNNKLNNLFNNYALKTEPNTNFPEMSDYDKKDIMKFDKYNYLKNKYNMEPLDFSNYLLDNLHNNISKNYLNKHK